MTNLAALRESTPDGTLPAFAWPGGYPLIYITADGSTICPDCANWEGETWNPEQAAIAGDVYWEGPTIQCEDCNADIESAYGDPEAQA